MERYGRIEVSAIIMHPKTFKESFKDIIGADVDKMTNPTCYGYKVYRSEDVEENDVVVL